MLKLQAFDKCDRLGSSRPRHVFVVVAWLKVNKSLEQKFDVMMILFDDNECFSGRQHSEGGQEPKSITLATFTSSAGPVSYCNLGVSKEVA